ncbi:MAG: hypothetical protein V1792_17180 [Pseudomonadota bacterium]
MNHKILLTLIALALIPSLLSIDAHSGGMGRPQAPPLDQTLMGFKETGVWYFLCASPTYLQRIPPHYATYGPPPPPCCPIPPAPFMCPQKVGPTLIKPKLVSPIPVRYP